MMQNKEEGSKNSTKTDRVIFKSNSRPKTDKTNKEGGSKNRMKTDRVISKPEKSKIQKDKTKAKVTKLYVVLDGDHSKSDNSLLTAFLNQRMGNVTAPDLEITEILSNKGEGQRHAETTIITLRFGSIKHASSAKHLLQVSNREAEDKLRCFFSKEEVLGESSIDVVKNEIEAKTAYGEMLETAAMKIKAHEDKIKSANESLIRVSEQLNTEVSEVNNEKLSTEKLALEDKLEELVLQKKEFERFFASMTAKLKELPKEEKFKKKLTDLRQTFGIECRRLDVALPMYARRSDILEVVQGNQVCVILGETGSGKSTQMVQYLCQAGLAESGLIACTQPRKIAATSLATHVSAEMGSRVGHVIGYQVGMQTKTNAETKVIFMTDHILLNECLKDKRLSRYACILIDEAHERSIHTDLLLGMLKEALEVRPELKVIITSATIDPEVFVAYFGGKDRCPVLKVSGRTFPVDVFWEDVEVCDNPFPEDYENKAYNKAVEIHNSTKYEDGDILVFLTSAVEVERCAEKMKQNVRNVLCLQLHGKLKPEEQKLAFDPTPQGKRKIVFATNVAETSITIPGIKFVVDTGVVKEMKFDPKKNMNCLDVVPVSQSSANQRKGRAGRMASGFCYRLYSNSDFDAMEKSSSPELLRIQVSQAMLKLLEFGVDPMRFHYVEAPTPASMKSAMDDLRDLGAVNESKLTDLGRWIARLSVEPRLGVFIKTGLDQEIAMECLVIASCCNQSGIFYRAGTKEEKKKSDLKKMKFCHPGGDLLTMLNAYREWTKIPEKIKGQWCQTNSINGKAMKGVREMVNEISTTLQREMKLNLKHEFKTPEVVDELVQNTIFECMKSNLSYYLGHGSAGYLIVHRQQRVQPHPSSAVLSLGLEPCWVVFNRVLKTSADFMTEVTPVPDAKVAVAVEEGKININMSSLEGQKVACVSTIPAGKRVYRTFVGPLHKNRRIIEEEIRTACDGSLVIVEADRQRRDIRLYSQPSFAQRSAAILQSKVEMISKPLLDETKEECIGSNNSGLRALIGQGGTVVKILLPDQFRSLHIELKETSCCDLDEGSAKKTLEVYGPVEKLFRFTEKKKSQFWGIVTFKDANDAKKAKESINKNQLCDFRIVPILFNKPRQEYTMRLSWCRRPCKGHCFVTSEDKTAFNLFPLTGRNIPVKGKTVSISQSKKQSDLFLTNLASDAMEDDIKASLAQVLGQPMNKTFSDKIRVVIPRPNASADTNERQLIEDWLVATVGKHTQRENFKLSIKEFQPKSVMCSAFVTFTDAEVGNQTRMALMGENLNINGGDLHMLVECKSSVHVKKPLYDLIKEDIDKLINEYKQANSSVTLYVRTLKSGHKSVDLKAQSPETLAMEKVKLDRVLCGDELDSSEMVNIHLLFTREGRKEAQNIAKATETIIFTDERRMKVTIQGLKEKRQYALGKIKEYISKISTRTETEVHLRGADNPPGLTKALILKYGLELSGLIEETGIFSVQLQLRYHEIIVKGQEDAVNLALTKIRNIGNELLANAGAETNTDGSDAVDCPVCLCPIEETDLCQLEYCGHAYCKCCLSNLMKIAVTEKNLPIVCAMENCNSPVVVQDIKFQIDIGQIQKEKLLDAALTSLVTKNREHFRFCITPDCDAVYSVSVDGDQFDCPLCFTKICTSCHIEYHEGLTCKMYQDALKPKLKEQKKKEEDESIQDWLKEDPKHRKICPKCKSGIEKVSGCNRMTCTCGANICWVCLQYFSSSGDCYTHLQNKHGGYFD